ncbi:hypothetical protein CRG98_037747 [Punica granatum]|uniref:Retrotransposon gag domain-containing protein n=1 Tax=Punica granatum TaxID=22663 RepID=A0A2I0ID23_PUNGR|nr:hypothetical protein CRG98_037747 [Punica granatum]
MKAVMRRRFAPSHYYLDLHLKLQNLKRGSKNVEEYHKEMEIAMIRANVEEDREATMAWFISGLNREIANIVELHHYVELEELVHRAMKVERQLKKGGRSSSRFESSNSNLKWTSKFEGHPRPYKLQWLNDSGEIRVNEQVLVAFRIGKYEDEVLCDVVPMQA